MPEIKLEGDGWALLRKLRMGQKWLGNIAAIFFAIALAAMADGLIAGMRAGSTRLEMLPGEQLAISGPAAVKNPLPSDVVARFNPPDCPLEFQLEGFFTGYWFGSGMWRGIISASAEPSHIACQLAVSFRGMPSKSAQNYEINIFENARDMQNASLSLMRRFMGIQPFQLAAACAFAGLLLGILTYGFGRVYVKKLLLNGLIPVYSPAPDGVSFLCVAARSAFVAGQKSYPVFDEVGWKIGEASALDWSKGKWRLAMSNAFVPPDGSLIGTVQYMKVCDKQDNLEN